MNKKAQVTIFVIIGAMVLLSAMLFFSLNKSLNEDKPEFDTLDVSLETRPVFELVNTCLEQVSLEALRKVASQGGWIEFPGLEYNEFPYLSDLVNFPPNKIAYWRHLDDCGNDLCEKSNMPPLCKPGSGISCFSSSVGDNSVQQQVERYIDENIDFCLNNFELLTEIYDIKVDGVPKSSVFFLKDETKIILNYPITISSLKNDATKTVKEFGVGFDIKMTEMYDLAKRIIDFEKRTNFYEVQTMNLITIYSGIDENIPPTSEVSFFDAGFNIWTQYEIKNLLEYDLFPFMSTIRFMNAKNYYPIVDESDDEYTKYSQGLYFGMGPKIGDDNTLYDFNIVHHYTYSPTYVRINNGESLLRPSNIGGDNMLLKMTGLFMKDYKFKYNFRYPLVITINDDSALNGLGFDFNFAVEVNVRNNIPAYNNFTTLNFDVPHEIGISDMQVRLPQEITVFTKNKLTNEYESDVIVNYICGREHEISQTNRDSQGFAKSVVQLPYCEMGGYLKFTKRGFAGVTIPYDNQLNGTAQTFEVSLWPLKEKEFILRKITEEKIDEIENAGAGGLIIKQNAYENLSASDVAIFNIQKEILEPYDETIPLIGFFRYQHPGTMTITEQNYVVDNFTLQALEQAYQEGTITLEDKNAVIESLNEANIENVTETIIPVDKKYTIELVPGNYNIDVTLINYDGVHIPLEEREIGSDSFIGDIIYGTETIILPEQNFSMWLTGGLLYDLSLSPNDVYNDKKIVIYILEMPKPNSWTDLENLKEISEYQKDKTSYIIPRFID